MDYLDETFGAGAPGKPGFKLYPITAKNGLLPAETVARVTDRAGTDEAWVLFDRDGSDRDADIQQALLDAAAAKVEVGFSHPSFDLWLLLHFQAFSGAQHGSSTSIVDRLQNTKATDAFREYDKRNNKNVTSAPRRKALHGNEQKAVDHARALVKHCEHGDCQPGTAAWQPVSRSNSSGGEPQQRISWQRWSARSGHAEHCPVLHRDPSTDVWRLLVSLGIVAVR